MRFSGRQRFLPGRLLLALLLLPMLAFLGSARQDAGASPSTTFTVNSTGDTSDANAGDGICDDGAGSCTLRAAIEEANATPGSDTIDFNIPVAGPHTIQPASPLPAIAAPIVLDATTQPGFAGSPIIELSGLTAGNGADGLVISGGSSVVQGLVVNRFSGSGIVLRTNDSNTVRGNFIGTNIDGTLRRANSGDGIRVESSNNSIGGTSAADRNIINGNDTSGDSAGVDIASGAAGNLVQGNYIGINAAGTAALGNYCGVDISGPNNSIGGSVAGARNIISGNTVGVFGNGSGNRIQGNFVGTDPSGRAPLANTQGINIGGQDNIVGGPGAGEGNLISGNTMNVAIAGANNAVQGNLIGTDVTGIACLANGGGSGVSVGAPASDNRIGGTVAGARNVISCIPAPGVSIYGVDTVRNVVQGNFIGTDVTGSVALGDNVGVQIGNGATNNTVGGTTPAAANVISGSTYGVYIASSAGPDSTDNLVEGNFIGTNSTGTAAIANRVGVVIENVSRNTIGGTTAAAANIISGNLQAGVNISGASAISNVVDGNFIGTQANGTSNLGNGSHGVLVESGANANTIGNATGGAGNRIAFNGGDGVRVDGAAGVTIENPLRGNSVYSNGGKGIENINGGNTELAPPVIDKVGTSVSGHTSPKCYPCTVDLYSDSDGQGRIYHGSTTTNNDATGTWAYAGSATGPNVTATITDYAGNTSEFSAPVPFPPVGGIAEYPQPQAQTSSSSDGVSAPNAFALAGAAGGAALLLVAGGWYARKRWLT